MTRDDYIKLHRQTVEAIDLVDNHGIENCVVEFKDNIDGDYWGRCDWMPNFDSRFYRARLKPQKRILPWESLDEVPLQHWFKHKGDEAAYPISGIGLCRKREQSVRVCRQWLTLLELYDDFEHAAETMYRKDLVWLPCGTEVVE